MAERTRAWRGSSGSGVVCALVAVIGVVALGACGGRIETSPPRGVGTGGSASNATSMVAGAAPSSVTGMEGSPVLVSCTYKGNDYVAGDTFPEGDGCNTCACTAHWGLGCTDLPCNE